MMKQLLIIIVSLLSSLLPIHKTQAQNNIRAGIRYEVINGDTLYMATLRTAWVTARKNFANDLERYKYNQLKHNIKVVFPFVKEAGRIFNEIKVVLPTLSNRERKKYIKQKEEELRVKFEEPIKNLYDTQGQLLLLLINRETGNDVYALLKEIKNPVRAALYETTALANGLNLRAYWDHKQYKDMEEIMEDLELQYGYSIPQ